MQKNEAGAAVLVQVTNERPIGHSMSDASSTFERNILHSATVQRGRLPHLYAISEKLGRQVRRFDHLSTTTRARRLYAQ